MRQEILSGPERRRRWSVDEKVRILAEAEVEGRENYVHHGTLNSPSGCL
jgi:hypothetical protein